MINGEKIIDHPIRWAVVGGGRDSLFGYMHRLGAEMDRNFNLVAGSFSTKAALEAGIHVLCEKPRTMGPFGLNIEFEMTMEVIHAITSQSAF
jgi:hypothetical protein